LSKFFYKNNIFQKKYLESIFIKRQNKQDNFVSLIFLIIKISFSLLAIISLIKLGYSSKVRLNRLREIEESFLYEKYRFNLLTDKFDDLFSLKSRNILLYLQILLLVGQSYLKAPIRKLADTSRQLPLRNISKLILDIREGRETLAMIGIRKPSLHYYSRQIVFYEPSTEEGLINLSERLNTDRRENYEDQPNYDYKSLLVVIDEYSTRRKQWSKINHQKLGKFGIYNLWRIQKSDLNKYSKFLVKSGYKSDWENRKVEKF